MTKYNADHPGQRCFVVSYDDFNPYLDEFRTRVRVRSKRPEKVLSEFQLWDHIDAILSIAVTKLIDGIFVTRNGPTDAAEAVPNDYRKRLSKHQRRDLLLLAACYDNSTSAPQAQRWARLQRRLHGWRLASWWPFLLAVVVTATVIAAGIYYRSETWLLDYLWLIGGGVAASWLPWIFRCTSRWFMAIGIAKRLRVIRKNDWGLARILMRFANSDFSAQPLPNKDRTDDRYRLLGKLQSILESLGFSGIAVLVDRVDEPHLINGSSDAMRALVWPMLDNKFLKQTGIGIKFLLPIELTQFIDREDKDFYQRARLDKQNMVPSLDWTGRALYDLANARLSACSTRQPPCKLSDLFDESVPDQRIFDALERLRVPRSAFRFVYRLLVAHCNKHSDEQPAWRITSDTFETELAIFVREQEAAFRGLASG